MILKTDNITFDLSNPLDISIPLNNTESNPIAWYLEKPIIEPVRFDNWVGKVSNGSSVNFNNIFFNPHGHGTHTECLGHITKDFYSINDCLKEFFFLAKVITIEPQKSNQDLIITKKMIEDKLLSMSKNKETQNSFQALVIRTLPNNSEKKTKKYSNTNPPYLTEETGFYLREIGVKHLLIDLPSIDRERDEGKLLAHKAFWNVTDVYHLNSDARLDCTITEMIFVDNTITDDTYLLNLQIASFENDASPSKPILYPKKN
ncbi:metal-dependent hydrolase [Flavobacterium covae]|uniref:Cyclase family protein n=1 Tax=Flavobacterium covae TaxID=2906076 RepID=A0ABW8PJG1_9FLAO|nr:MULTISPECIES: cyclase family protein [Flavobacterium]OWP80194.1 metal-dependent hydrolase [Flavobacterium covae]POR20861.1 metal-dependent hydrolase [Flavobacterium columnare]